MLAPKESLPPKTIAMRLRDVARSCIHGVDRNPMAVELTKVALWIETVEPGKPLGFLDANIRCGDSLLGVYDLEVLREGIPDAAYKPLSGDDKVIARDFEKRNKAQRTGQGRLRLLGGSGQLPAPPPLAGEARALRGLPEDDAQQIAEKRKKFDAALKDPLRWKWRIAADAYVAAFLGQRQKRIWPIRRRQRFRRRKTFGMSSQAANFMVRWLGGCRSLHSIAGAFHWPLEFPDVMASGGFDVVLGNPPWDRIKLQEQEFFAAREQEIAMAANAAARGRMIARLKAADTGTRERALYDEFEMAKRVAEASSIFAREAGRFPLTGCGDVNTYALFAELFANLASSRGRAGVIVPTGIATDATTAPFFNALMSERRLFSLHDFQTGLGFFDRIGHARFKFCLLTLGRPRSNSKAVEFSFFSRTISEFADQRRRFTLSPVEIGLLNPNTQTAPIFRSQFDADLTAKLYARAPILQNEAKGLEGNPWGISFITIFHMAERQSASSARQHNFNKPNL